MVIKIMLDTNSYDFIHDNNLTEKFNHLVKEGKIENYGTHVQVDEIDKITDKDRIQQLKKIECEFIPSSVGFVGIDYKSKRGFDGSKSGGCKVIGEEDSKIIDEVKTPLTQTHPLGNTADIAIVFTSIKESLDYLVSDNDHIHKIFKKMNKKMRSKLKVITNQQFQKLILNT